MMNQAFSSIFASTAMGEEKLIDQIDDTGNMESVNEIEWIPRLGMEFISTEAAWDFWVSYAHKIGFHARKSYNNRSILDGKTTSRAYVCANEGFRAKDKRDHLTKYPRQETRTGCQVRLVLKLNKKSKKYEITEFISEHNHIQISQQKVTKVVTVDVEFSEASEIPSKEAHELMGLQIGKENSDHTLTDKSNCSPDATRHALHYQDLCDKFSRIAAKACTNEESYVFVVDFLDKLEKQIDEMILNISNPSKSNCKTVFAPDLMDNFTQNPPCVKKSNRKKEEKRNTILVEICPVRREKKTCKKQHAVQCSTKSVISSAFEKALEIPDSSGNSDAQVKWKGKSGECQQYEPDSFTDSMMKAGAKRTTFIDSEE